MLPVSSAQVAAANRASCTNELIMDFYRLFGMTQNRYVVDLTIASLIDTVDCVTYHQELLVYSRPLNHEARGPYDVFVQTMENGQSPLLDAQDNADIFEAQFDNACKFLRQSWPGWQSYGMSVANCERWDDALLTRGLSGLVAAYASTAMDLADLRERARVFNSSGLGLQIAQPVYKRVHRLNIGPSPSNDRRPPRPTSRPLTRPQPVSLQSRHTPTLPSAPPRSYSVGSTCDYPDFADTCATLGLVDGVFAWEPDGTARLQGPSPGVDFAEQGDIDPTWHVCIRRARIRPLPPHPPPPPSLNPPPSSICRRRTRRALTPLPSLSRPRSPLPFPGPCASPRLNDLGGQAQLDDPSTTTFSAPGVLMGASFQWMLQASTLFLAPAFEAFGAIYLRTGLVQLDAFISFLTIFVIAFFVVFVGAMAFVFVPHVKQTNADIQMHRVMLLFLPFQVIRSIKPIRELVENILAEDADSPGVANGGRSRAKAAID